MTGPVRAFIRLPGQRWRLVAESDDEDAARALLRIEAVEHPRCDLLLTRHPGDPNEKTRGRPQRPGNGA